MKGMKANIYIGTYTTNRSEGIYRLEYEDGKISPEAKLFAKLENPKYLCFAGEYIAAVCDISEDFSGICLLDKNGKILDKLAYETSTSCYIDYFGGNLYTVNYHKGSFAAISMENGKLKLLNQIEIMPKAGAHQILFWKDFYLIPCLNLDKIMIYKGIEPVGTIEFERNSGPRHGVFIEGSEYLYVVGELSNLLYVVDVKKRKVVHQVKLLEDGRTHLKDSAAIRYYKGYIYVSTRTQDIISVFELDENQFPKLIQNISSFGKHPRDFVLFDDVILIANRDSDNLVMTDIHDGKLNSEYMEGKAFEPIALIVEEI